MSHGGPAPADFRANWRVMSQEQLTEHYERNKKVIERWVRELGLRRTSATRPAFYGRTVKPPVEKMEGLRSTLPTEPCFRCGARGWCAHRSEAA